MSENSKRDPRVPEFRCPAGRSVCPLFFEMHCRIIDLDNANKRLRERVLELEKHIEEANANAPRALVEALEALTDRSNEVFRLQGQIDQLKDSS